MSSAVFSAKSTCRVRIECEFQSEILRVEYGFESEFPFSDLPL